MDLKDVVIIDGARTPVGKFGGSLKDISASDLAGMAIKEAVKRSNVSPDDVDETIVGQVGQIDEDGFIGRTAMLKGGIPKDKVAYSVNRQCGSGLQSIANAAMQIQTGRADVVVASGTENMSALPYYSYDTRFGARIGDKKLKDGLTSILTYPLGPYHNGETGENVAQSYNVSREEQDEYALQSQQRASQAIEEGLFEDEILPVEITDRKGNVSTFDTDEGPRKNQTLEQLEKLKPAFAKNGTVTAGNASSITDGAAAVVVMSKEKALELGLTPKLVMKDFEVVGFDGELMGYAPKISSENLAHRLNINLTDIDMIEVNEAFASSTVAVIRDLGLDMNKVNMYGGGISIGHPVGATGTILTVKTLYELMRSDKKDAMISMCIGGGQGISMYFEKYSN